MDYANVLEVVKKIQDRKMELMNELQQAELSRLDGLYREINELDELERNQMISLRNMNNQMAESIEMQGIFKEVIGDNITDLDRELVSVDTSVEDMNRKRLLQITEYQAKQYAARNRIVMLVLVVIVVLLGLTYILKNGMIGDGIFASLVALVLVVGIVLFVYLLMDLNSRDDFDFDRLKQLSDLDQGRKGYETVIEHDKKFFKGLFDGLMRRMGAVTDLEEEIYNQRKGKALEKITAKHESDVNVSIEGLEGLGRFHPSQFESRGINVYRHGVGEAYDGTGSVPLLL
jgi:hypothetical protein